MVGMGRGCDLRGRRKTNHGWARRALQLGLDGEQVQLHSDGGATSRQPGCLHPYRWLCSRTPWEPLAPLSLARQFGADGAMYIFIYNQLSRRWL